LQVLHSFLAHGIFLYNFCPQMGTPTLHFLHRLWFHFMLGTNVFLSRLAPRRGVPLRFELFDRDRPSRFNETLREQYADTDDHSAVGPDLRQGGFRSLTPGDSSLQARLGQQSRQAYASRSTITAAPMTTERRRAGLQRVRTQERLKWVR
jgi:hypothetical protein